VDQASRRDRGGRPNVWNEPEDHAIAIQSERDRPGAQPADRGADGAVAERKVPRRADVHVDADALPHVVPRTARPLAQAMAAT
jgi:hypothetical protein